MNLGGHVFQVAKYRRVHDLLLSSGILNPDQVLEPEPATIEDAVRVHTREYVQDLLGYRHTARTYTSEIPLNKEVVDAYFLAAGCTLLACEKALDEGGAINPAGGFHHAFPDHAEGFCYLNDIAMGIRRLLDLGRIERAAVIDCDLHQGNGTAAIFGRDKRVFTFSIHQENLYPIKQQSKWDIGLDDFTGDILYLEKLSEAVSKILDRHSPEIVLYQAGVDTYEMDQLGSLKLTRRGLKARDELVVGECRSRSIPIVGLLGGGYALNPDDTVELHAETCRVFFRLLR